MGPGEEGGGVGPGGRGRGGLGQLVGWWELVREREQGGRIASVRQLGQDRGRAQVREHRRGASQAWGSWWGDGDGVWCGSTGGGPGQALGS